MPGIYQTVRQKKVGRSTPYEYDTSDIKTYMQCGFICPICDQWCSLESGHSSSHMCINGHQWL